MKGDPYNLDLQGLELELMVSTLGLQGKGRAAWFQVE